jgi:hypothetical protein
MTAVGALFLLLQLARPPCAPTATEPLLPDLVGLATGVDPAWLVDGGHSSETATKTRWIFKTHTPVRVRGDELGSGYRFEIDLNGDMRYITVEIK